MLDISPLLNGWGLPLLALVLLGLAMWIIKFSGAWLDAHAAFLDASTRQKILDAEREILDEGAQVVMAQAKHLGDNVKLSISNPVVRFGAQVAINHAAGMLADNGADPEEVAAKILARLPPVMIEANPAVAAAPKPPAPPPDTDNARA